MDCEFVLYRNFVNQRSANNSKSKISDKLLKIRVQANFNKK